MRGTLDHAFEGRKVAEGLHTKKLIVNMQEVSPALPRVGHVGVMDFLRISSNRDLYIVEGSSYAVNHIWSLAARSR